MNDINNKLKDIHKLKLDAEKEVEKNNFELASQFGSQAMSEESKIYCDLQNISVNSLSFSLFGDDPLYCETAIFNAMELPKIYPNWQMSVYHDKSVPTHVIKRLQSFTYVTTMDVATIGIGHWPGTFWRFYEAMQPNRRYLLFRDADSVVCHREKVLVDDWMQQRKPFHLIRDWYSHTDLILAGLWGSICSNAERNERVD